MNIVCLTPWFPHYPGDKTGNFILDSVEALAGLGHSVSVLVTRPLRVSGRSSAAPAKARHGLADVVATDLASTNISVHLSLPRNALRPLSNWFYHRAVAGQLAGLAREVRADLIHAHTEIPGVTAVRVAEDLDLPSVVTIHGINTNPILNGSRQRAFYRKHLSRATRIVLVGEPLREYMASIVGRSAQFRVVHNGFRPPPEDFPHAKWDPPLRLVSVSNLHEGKGIDVTLQALRRLADSGITDWSYAVVGGGYQSAVLQQMASDLGLSDNVAFAGPCDHHDVYRHLSRANVFVLPSYIEAFGIAYLEAMALGLLAIGVKGQGPSGFIRDGETGLLVEPRSVDSLFTCLRAINDDLLRMKQIASRGRDHVCHHLTWRNHAESLTAVFAEVL